MCADAKAYEDASIDHAEEARQRPKSSVLVDTSSSQFLCKFCQKQCQARIRLISHENHSSKRISQ